MLPTTTTTTTTATPLENELQGLISLMAPPCGNETLPLLLPGQTCDGENCTLVASSPGATIISPVLLCLAGITGHVLALCYLYSGQRRSSSHTVFYLLLCTLIWTDFLGKLVTTPNAIISYAFGRWVGGRDTCLFHGFVMILVQQVTHFTVAAMAVERLLAICHGYLYERLVTHSRCWSLLASLWVFALLLCLLPLFGLGELYLQYPFTWCYVNIHLCPNTPLRHRFFTTGLGVLDVGCLVTVVACNVCVVGSLLRMRLSRQVPAHLSSGRRPSVQRDQELQMVVLLVVITIAFVVSWAPLNIILVSNLLWPPHLTREDHVGDLIAIRLVSISQILDPWVYIICRVIFQSKLWRSMRRAMVGRRWSRRRSSHSVKIKSIVDESQSEPSCGPVLQPAPPPAPHPVQEGVGGVPGVDDDTALGNGTPTLGPAWQGTHTLQNPALGPGVGEGAPLARSVSLAIPIPLFICEHYSMAQHGAGHVAPCCPDPAMLPTGQQVLRARSCCLDHHLPLPAMPGVLRSYSWGCRARAAEHRPHHRSCSTQTLPGDAHTTHHAHTPTPPASDAQT